MSNLMDNIEENPSTKRKLPWTKSNGSKTHAWASSQFSRLIWTKFKEASQGEYGDLREIIVRYAVLAEARSFLMNRTDSTRETVARRSKALERDVLMNTNEVLAYRNFLTELVDSQQTLHNQVFKHMHRNARITPEDTLGQLVDIGISVREMYMLAKDIKHMLKVAYVTEESEAAAREKQRRKEEERQKKIGREEMLGDWECLLKRVEKLRVNLREE
ncbi:unnamed protein product [Orchesella dallaii]|uniref:Uncharacterized protein n=1 Tax=Orchesella dallaii TaxID=48710 RepID=A0ABP1RW39_9HEXA